MKVAIMTDSNSGITQQAAKELGVFVIPMPFTIDNKEYKEDINLSQDEFYHMLMNDHQIFTSQPAAGEVTAYFDKILEEYDQIVHIPMSSGLSGSCQTAMMLASESEYNGKVFVVDSQRISVLLKQDVLTALELSRQGKSGQEIHDILMENKMKQSIYITVNTLEYLKRGGRVTPAAAALGGLLKIKPILSIFGEKLDSFSKTRTITKAKSIMIDAIIKDIKDKIGDESDDYHNTTVMIAYTYNQELALEFKEQLQSYFPHHEIYCDPLSLSIACHVGPNALGVGICKKII